jgi:hypothetical protein
MGLLRVRKDQIYSAEGRRPKGIEREVGITFNSLVYDKNQKRFLIKHKVNTNRRELV